VDRNTFLALGFLFVSTAHPAHAQTIAGASQPGTFVTCQVNGTANSTGDCVNDNAGNGYSPGEATGVLLSSVDYNALFPAEAFSADTASEYFFAGLTLVLATYCIGLMTGVILRAVRTIL
jgi:hypothetical protein